MILEKSCQNTIKNFWENKGKKNKNLTVAQRQPFPLKDTSVTDKCV